MKSAYVKGKYEANTQPDELRHLLLGSPPNTCALDASCLRAPSIPITYRYNAKYAQLLSTSLSNSYLCALKFAVIISYF